MSVRMRRYRGGSAWEVDIAVRRPNGEDIRERRKAPVQSKEAAKRWAEQRAAHLLQHGKDEPKDEQLVPTLKEFAPVFLDRYAWGFISCPCSAKGAWTRSRKRTFSA